MPWREGDHPKCFMFSVSALPTMPPLMGNTCSCFRDRQDVQAFQVLVDNQETVETLAPQESVAPVAPKEILDLQDAEVCFFSVYAAFKKSCDKDSQCPIFTHL